MRIIIVDDDDLSRELFEIYCLKVEGVELVGSFSNAADALSFAKREVFDMAVLDIVMPGLNGIELGWALKSINPHIVLSFISSSEDFAMDAFRLKAFSYIVKPFDKDSIIEALERGKRLCFSKSPQVFVRTFGHFDVFINGKPMKFSRRKSKEILAYLINRDGGIATIEQITNDLWEDKPLDSSVRSSFQSAFKDLRKNLAEAGISDILISGRNQKSINKHLIDCDYYRFLDGDPDAIDAFRYEYMIDYSWAEATTAYLSSLKEKYDKNSLNIV